MQTGRERLRAWIERSKLNQVQAAEILSINYVMLSQMLTGVRSPGLSTAIKIEDITGISVRSWGLSRVSKDETAEPAMAGKPKVTKR
jgi:transcriptional regulator with XRE-family HTH domain